MSQEVRRTGDKIYLRKDVSDRTPYGLTVGGKLKAEDVLGSVNFLAGLFGWRVTPDGFLEVEGLKVRSFAEFYELVVNRLSAIEGDQLFSESDTIEEVDDHGDGTFTLKLNAKWDGYFTAQHQHNVCKGIYNNITQGLTPGVGQESLHNALYYTSWFRVLTVNEAANSIDVVMYADEDVPAGRNFPPQPMMRFARWGNAGAPSDLECKRRQTLLFLSATEGSITKLYHVTKPIIDKGNVAAVVGRVPDFIADVLGLSEESREGGYFATIIAEKFIQRDHEGRPTPVEVYRGPFDEDAMYYAGDTLNPDNGLYELSRVLQDGCQWLCAKTGTHTAPRWGNPDWVFWLGDPSFRLSMSGPAAINPRTCDFFLTVTAYKHNQDVSADVLPQDIVWTRYSEDKDGIERAASDTIWATKRGGSGMQITLTQADLDRDIKGIPPVCLFRATVTLRDGVEPTTKTVTYGDNKTT